jgi:hypothetical protein
MKDLLHNFKGAVTRVSSEDKERKFNVRNIKILPTLSGYNNYSHQIVFEMEETRLKKIVCRHKPWEFVKTRNRAKEGIKNRTNNEMDWNNHTKSYRVHI